MIQTNRENLGIYSIVQYIIRRKFYKHCTLGGIEMKYAT